MIQYDLEQIEDRLSSVFNSVPYITIGELVVDRFPLFLCSNCDICVSSSSTYINKYSLFYSLYEDGAGGLFDLFYSISNYDFGYKSLKSYNGSCKLATWARFVESMDFMTTEHVVDIVKFYKDNINYFKINTDLFLFLLDNVRYFDDIYNDIRSVNKVQMRARDMASSPNIDILYYDATTIVPSEELLKSINKPIIMLARKNAFSGLDGWFSEECGGVTLMANSKGILDIGNKKND